MITPERYIALLKSGKYHEAAREAHRCAVELERGTNPETDMNKNLITKLTAYIRYEAATRYLHLVDRAVLRAHFESAWDELRAIRDDQELMDALEEGLREAIILYLSDNAPTLVGPPPAA